MNNRQIDFQSASVANNKYEYPKTPLSDSESKYIYIPLSVITDSELDIKRVGVFSYFRIHCGLNDTIGFTIPDLVEWCGAKPDRRVNGSNSKFLTMVDDLSSKGYLTYITEKSKSSFMRCRFDMDYYYEECSDGYAVIYLDEIEKIMNYKKENEKDRTLTNTTLLLIFAYFRNKIRRRPNELKPEERTTDGIKKRRERLPEAFDSNITTIAKEIGVHKQTLSKAIDILEQELELIVTDRAYRIKNEDGEFRTLPTVFANTYKREDRYLLAAGEEYSRNEIELKVKYINQHYQEYKIDKRKRKNKKGEANCE